MGAVFYNLTCEELCELMCGKPEEDDEMGGRGNSGSRNSETFEKAKLIFGTARITSTFIDIDGYSNKKTEKGMLNELAKAVDPYSKSEAGVLRDMVKFNEISQAPYDGGGYILEWEEVPNAGRYNDDDEYESAEARYYVHIRFNR